jgi:uncharacterized protein
MGTRDSHAPGTFSWADLATSDAAAAKEFYAELLGWEYEDLPAGPGVYSMARRGGRDVAALSERADVPPSWNSYVTVEAVEDAAQRAARLGATIVAAPFDVMEAGRMAVLQDPTGAFVSVWEPREHAGAALVNEPGALTLNQLNTDDPERAGAFYAALFGWRVQPVGEGETPYWGIYNGETLNGGMMPLPPGGGAPPHWLVYFGSEAVDADAERIGRLGGSVLVPAMDVPGGRIVVAADPQGAAFALLSGRFDP